MPSLWLMYLYHSDGVLKILREHPLGSGEAHGCARLGYAKKCVDVVYLAGDFLCLLFH